MAFCSLVDPDETFNRYHLYITRTDGMTGWVMLRTAPAEAPFTQAPKWHRRLEGPPQRRSGHADDHPAPGRHCIISDHLTCSDYTGDATGSIIRFTRSGYRLASHAYLGRLPSTMRLPFPPGFTLFASSLAISGAAAHRAVPPTGDCWHLRLSRGSLFYQFTWAVCSEHLYIPHHRR